MDSRVEAVAHIDQKIKDALPKPRVLSRIQVEDDNYWELKARLRAKKERLLAFRAGLVRMTAYDVAELRDEILAIEYELSEFLDAEELR